MKTNSELKNRAIDALTGNWGLGAVITLVYGLVMKAHPINQGENSLIL